MAAGLVMLWAPQLHAASSSKTVGVVIIMPERTDLAESDQAGPPADPSEEPRRPPPGHGMVRTTTVVAGDGGRLLITDVPEL